MDDIDFSLILHKHGWTTFFFYVDKKCYEILISGVFSDPFYDFMNLLISLLNNENEVNIQCLGEPGGYEIKIIRNKTQRHLLNIKINDFEYDVVTKVATNKSELVSFEIKQKQFLIIGFSQLKKTYCLLQEQSFANDRRSEFPYHLYDELTKRIAVDFPGL
jgi:hypothetical protein